jgi:hypothetical protein
MRTLRSRRIGRTEITISRQRGPKSHPAAPLDRDGMMTTALMRVGASP